MRIAPWPWLSAALLFGCQSPEPTAPTPAPATAEAPVTATPAPAPAPKTIAGTAARVGAQPPPSPEDQRKLDAFQPLERKQSYDFQLAIPAPPGLPAHATALIPPTDARLVEAELHRRMIKRKPAPERRHISLRWATLKRGEALSALIAERLVAAGWIAQGDAPRSPIEKPEWGTLSWTVLEPPLRPSRVAFTLDGPDESTPIPMPDTLFEKAAPWSSVVRGGQLMGFEFGRYHDGRGRATYSDLERFAGIYRSADAAALERALHDHLVKSGYRVDDDDPRLLRAPGPIRTTFTTRLAPDGSTVTVHHQLRWLRTDPAAKANPGPGRSAKPKTESNR